MATDSAHWTQDGNAEGFHVIGIAQITTVTSAELWDTPARKKERRRHLREGAHVRRDVRVTQQNSA